MAEAERNAFISAIIVFVIAVIFLVLANRSLRSRNDLRNILNANSASLPPQAYVQGMKDTDDMYGLLKAVQIIAAIEVALFVFGFVVLLLGGSYLFYKAYKQQPEEAGEEEEEELQE